MANFYKSYFKCKYYQNYIVIFLAIYKLDRKEIIQI